MNSRFAYATGISVGLMLLLVATPLRADLIASTSFEEAEGYTPPGGDVRNYEPLTEPGDWGGSTWDGEKGGALYTGVLATPPGTAYDGQQFMFMQRPGTSSDGEIKTQRDFPTQTGLLYYRFAFGIDSMVEPGGEDTRYWEDSREIRLTTYADDGDEAFVLGLSRDGSIIVHQSSFGSDIQLTKRWDGTTTDGSPSIASALNSWVSIEVMMDIPGQQYWLFWHGTYLGNYRFRDNGSRALYRLQYRTPRLDFAARGERLRIDDIELRTDPPAAMAGCVLVAEPGDVIAEAWVGQPATPSAIDYTLHDFGDSSADWTATVLDANQQPLPVSWLSLSSTGGTLASMSSVVTTASIDTSGLSGGEYVAYVKFSDNCNPANETIREVRLIVTGCTWTVSSCDQVRSYLADYPEMPVADVVYRITNTGQFSMNYWVAQSGSSCLAGLWTLTNAAGTLQPQEYIDVVATVDLSVLDGQPADETYTCDLTFTDDCSSQVVDRQIRLRYVEPGDTYVFQYAGNVDPMINNSAGDNLRFDLYREDGLSHYGAVEDDPDASDGKAWRVQDDDQRKTKYRVTFTDTGNPVEIENEVGATVVARVKVRSQTGSREGGLFMWDKDSLSCAYHWGGIDGVIEETRRDEATTVAGTDQFVILRMTAIGRSGDSGDCSRMVRLYFNEDPTPVVELVAASTETNLYEGIGFGAGSTSGTYDIAFDWIAGTNAGAFAPGEEEAVLGISLTGTGCPVDWADFNSDGYVDMLDFAEWQLCVTGPGDPSGQFDTENCGCADRDGDNDVDINDAEAFAACATGPGVPFDVDNPPSGCQ